jgi:Ca-activated chloride channel family protein
VTVTESDPVGAAEMRDEIGPPSPEPRPESSPVERLESQIPEEEDLSGRLQAISRQDVAAKPSRDSQPAPRVQAESGVVSDAPKSVEHKRRAAFNVTSESPSIPEQPQREQRSRKQKKVLGYRSQVAEPAPEGRFAESQRHSRSAPSTGGTAEPNDAPYGDMFFTSYGTTPFVDTEDAPLSTFGLDVDTGSFTLARSFIEGGHLPPHEAIRVEEFVNYFDYGDPAPRRGEFTLIAEGAPSPFATGAREQLVRFGIKAHEILSADRRPATLIVVVDISGSMKRENRLGLVKRSLTLLLDQLYSEDRIGLVVYGSRGEVLLEPTTNQDAIRRAIDRLVPGGSTNAEEGLDLAYGLARRNYRGDAINRVILCSDGVANVGRTGADSILDKISIAADEGIELTTVGFGMGNYNDVLMEQLADKGDGNYAYVDTLEEARRIFVENLTGTLQTIASDAKAQVEFNPEAVSRYRLLGYENRDIADERFRDDSVDAGEIGAGHAVTALYEIKLHEGVSNRKRLATLRLRYRSKATDEIVESSIDLRLKEMARSWEGSSTSLQLSSLAAEFAEILKGSFWAKESDLVQVRRHLRPLADELVTDEQVQDLLYLVERAMRLSSDVRESLDD